VFHSTENSEEPKNGEKLEGGRGKARPNAKGNQRKTFNRRKRRERRGRVGQAMVVEPGSLAFVIFVYLLSNFWGDWVVEKKLSQKGTKRRAGTEKTQGAR
jgi:hypothetical protein